MRAISEVAVPSIAEQLIIPTLYQFHVHMSQLNGCLQPKARSPEVGKRAGAGVGEDLLDLMDIVNKQVLRPVNYS